MHPLCPRPLQEQYVQLTPAQAALYESVLEDIMAQMEEAKEAAAAARYVVSFCRMLNLNDTCAACRLG
jgi:hypothetical protein